MFEILLGHLFGDYLLQNEWMALNKSKNNWVGWIAAITHCVIYTSAVCMITNNYDILWMVIVFISHFFIDKFNLAHYYLLVIKGRNLRKFLDEDKTKDVVLFTDSENGFRNIALRGGFNAVVYTITDNTMHLLLMYWGYQILY